MDRIIVTVVAIILWSHITYCVILAEHWSRLCVNELWCLFRRLIVKVMCVDNVMEPMRVAGYSPMYVLVIRDIRWSEAVFTSRSYVAPIRQLSHAWPNHCPSRPHRPSLGVTEGHMRWHSGRTLLASCVYTVACCRFIAHQSRTYLISCSRGDAGVFIARVATAAGAVSTDAVSRLHIHTIHRGPTHA